MIYKVIVLYYMLLERFALFILVLSCLSVVEGRAEKTEAFPFRKFREAHHTKLEDPIPVPPKDLFSRISYQSKVGELSAYVTPDPADGAKHPLVIWLVGGFSNSIGSNSWEEADASNDQSAAAYRKAGLLMMFPALRGGEGNPGRIEVCCGEVDDVIAAAKHAASLSYVDPSRIYLGGHSTGGTLALLVAASTDVFRAVISFGPVHSVITYGRESLPFDPTDRRELLVRAPIMGLPYIQSPTFVLEGETGNIEPLKLMKEKNVNKNVRFWEIPGATHFNDLAPFNAMWAQKILKDSGPKCNLDLSDDEVKATALKVIAKKPSSR